MPDYPVNPTDPTSPLNSQPARKGSEEFRALKAYIATLVIAATSGSTVRQAIQDAAKTAGLNTAITTGAGLRPGLSATTTPYQLSYASGFNSGKPLDVSESLTADVADILGADLQLSNTSYLSKVFASGNVFEANLVPPQEGITFDRTAQSLVHFEQSPPLCDFGNTYTLTGATIDAVKFAYGTKALNASAGAGTNANVKRAESANITTLGPDSWEAQCVTWFDVQPNAGVFHYLFAAVNNGGFGAAFGWKETGGNRRAFMQLSSDAATFNIGDLTGITNLVVGKWYRFRMIFDLFAGSYKLFVADGGAGAVPVWTAEVQEIAQASALKICTITRTIWGCLNNGIYIAGISGWIDEARIIHAATKTALTTPGVAPDTYPLAIDAQPIYWMDIVGMKLYKVTLASGAAAVDPTFTAQTRLFVGEADTSGVAVIATRNYAIRGNFITRFLAPAVGAATSKVSNLGTLIVDIDTWLVCITADQGYSPGERLKPALRNNGDATGALPLQMTNRNNIRFTNADNSIRIPHKTAFNTVIAATGSWDVEVMAKRNW